MSDVSVHSLLLKQFTGRCGRRHRVLVITVIIIIIILSSSSSKARIIRARGDDSSDTARVFGVRCRDCFSLA